MEGQGFDGQAAAPPARSVQVHRARLDRPHRQLNLNLPRNRHSPHILLRIPVHDLSNTASPIFILIHDTRVSVSAYSAWNGTAGTEDWLQFGSKFVGKS